MIGAGIVGLAAIYHKNGTIYGRFNYNLRSNEFRPHCRHERVAL